MLLARIFIIFALSLVISADVSAITGVEILEHYSKTLKISYHGTLEQQAQQEQDKRYKAVTAVTLITTGILPIGKGSLPKGLCAKQLLPLKPMNSPPYVCSKHFGFATTSANNTVKSLYMEIVMAAFFLKVDVKSLLHNATAVPYFAHLCGPGKHLSLLQDLWNTLEQLKKDPFNTPHQYFKEKLEGQRLGGSDSIDFWEFQSRVRRMFPDQEDRKKEAEDAYKEANKGIRNQDLHSLKPEFINSLSSKRTLASLQNFLLEFPGSDVQLMRNGARYQVELCQRRDPRFNVYRTPVVEMKQRLESNTGYTQSYGSPSEGMSIHINNYLRDHREDPDFRWPDFMQLPTPSGEMIRLLERSTPTSIVFSSPAPFLIDWPLPASPTPLVLSRDVEPTPASVYDALLLLTQGIAHLYPPTSLLTLHIVNKSYSSPEDDLCDKLKIRDIIDLLDLSGGIASSKPFLGPTGTVFSFVRNWKNKTFDVSYLLACDAQTNTLVKSIDCSTVINFFPTYVLIPTHGYLCVAAEKTSSGNALLFFDLIKGQQVTTIRFKNAPIREESHNLTINLGQLDIQDLEYFPNHQKIRLLFASSGLLRESDIKAEVVIDLVKLWQGLHKSESY